MTRSSVIGHLLAASQFIWNELIVLTHSPVPRRRGIARHWLAFSAQKPRPQLEALLLWDCSWDKTHMGQGRKVWTGWEKTERGWLSALLPFWLQDATFFSDVGKRLAPACHSLLELVPVEERWQLPVINGADNLQRKLLLLSWLNRGARLENTQEEE